jgi:hypothetical protein
MPQSGKIKSTSSILFTIFLDRRFHVSNFDIRFSPGLKGNGLGDHDGKRRALGVLDDAHHLHFFVENLGAGLKAVHKFTLYFRPWLILKGSFSLPGGRRGGSSAELRDPLQHPHHLIRQNRQVQADFINRVKDPKNPGEIHENVLERVHGRVFKTQGPFFQERPAD